MRMYLSIGLLVCTTVSADAKPSPLPARSAAAVIHQDLVKPEKSDKKMLSALRKIKAIKPLDVRLVTPNSPTAKTQRSRGVQKPVPHRLENTEGAALIRVGRDLILKR